MKSVKRLLGNKVVKTSFFVGLFFLTLSLLNQNGVISIRLIINKFIPCDGANFPTSIYYYCYSVYDFSFYLISTSIYSASFLITIITIIHWLIKRTK
jgi:uncharacterized membrane protein (Fun14 family)